MTRELAKDYDDVESIYDSTTAGHDVVTREELYALVWSKPMTKVAKQFDVSGSYLARVCRGLNVPRPARGYWAKMAVGRSLRAISLPEAQPGDPLVWSRNGTLELRPASLLSELPYTHKAGHVRSIRGRHVLIDGAKDQFLSSRQVEEGQHLKPYKKLLVDINASKKCLDKAMSFANQLFIALESSGHRVRIAPYCEGLQRVEIDEHEIPRNARNDYLYYHPRLWSPCRSTVVYVSTVAIGLAIVEMSEEVLMRRVNGRLIRAADYVPPKALRYSEDRTWTTHEDVLCGRLRLIAYSPYSSVSWSTNWQETKETPITREIPAILKTIREAANDLNEKLKDAERQAEIQRLEWAAEQERRRQEEDRRLTQKSIQDSRAHLDEIIQKWGEVMNVERFFQGVSELASELPPDERHIVLERLKVARESIGTRNPLDFFRSWKTPIERYRPLSSRTEDEGNPTDDDSDDGVISDG